MGKSLVCLDLCARLSTGRPLPDGSLGPGRAIRAAAETETLPAARAFTNCEIPRFFTVSAA